MEIFYNNRKWQQVNSSGTITASANYYFYSHTRNGGLKTSTKKPIESPTIMPVVV